MSILIPEKTLPQGFSWLVEGSTLYVVWEDAGNLRRSICDGDGDIAGPSVDIPAGIAHISRGWDCAFFPLGNDVVRIARWLQFAEFTMRNVSPSFRCQDRRYGWHVLYCSCRAMLLNLSLLTDRERVRYPETFKSALLTVSRWRKRYEKLHDADKSKPRNRKRKSL